MTTRAAVLALVFCAVLLTLAYPLKQYLDQRGQINHVASANKATEQRLRALTQEHQQAQNPDTVEREARERLHYTYPGQQNYIVIAPSSPVPAAAEPGRATVPRNPGSTWYDRLWGSTVAAGNK